MITTIARGSETLERSNNRNTGIEVIGEMPWGAHFCQFYQTQCDLLDILVPYFRAGLENNELCVWVTSEFLTRDEALAAMKKSVPGFTGYLKKGQMQIFPYTDWYIKEGKFELQRVLNQWIAKHGEALQHGYDGLRVSGNPFWIDNKKDWEDFTAYEAEINNVIDQYNILVLCTYSLDKCGSYEIMDVVANHEFAVIKRQGNWELIESSVHKRAEQAFTEQKKAEEALKITATKYTTMFDTISDGIWIHNMDGVIIDVNDAYCRMSGYTREELINMSLSQLEAVESPQQVTEHIQKLRRSGGHDRFESLHRRKDGSVFNVDITALFLDINGGQIAIFTRDITERKQMEESFAKNQKELQDIIDALPAWIFYKDKENRFLRVNKSFAAIMGMSRDELEGKSLFDIYPHELANAYWQDDKDVIASGKPKMNIIEINKTPQGEIRCQTDKIPYRDAKGNILGIIGLTVDITERLKAEERLKKSEEKYKELVENANSIIIKMNTQGRFTFFNEFAQKFFGFTEQEIIGKTATETIVPQIESTGRDLQFMLQKIYTDPDKFSLNINENIKKTGERVWVEWHNKSLFDNTGNRIGHIAIGTDITERVNAEYALQKNYQRLKILSDTASQLLASSDPQNTVNELCNRVMKFLDCHAFFNYIIDPKENKLHLNAYAGIPETTAKEIGWLNFGVAVCGCVARDGERIIAENISESDDARTQLVKSFGIKAYACHPLMSQDKVLGTLSFGTKSRSAFNYEDIALMKSVADLVAIAISRVKAEKELYDTKNYLETLINYANAPIIVWNPQFEVQVFNRAFEELTGHLSADIIGKKIDILFPEESFEESQEIIRKALTENLETVEIPILGKNKEVRTILWNSAKIYDGDNKTLISIIAQGHDITVRKEALKALQKSEEKLNLALENGNIGVWVWNIITNEIEWDERMERIFGIQQGSFGRTYAAFESFVVEEDIPHLRKAIQAALVDNKPFETVYRIKKDNGEINYISAKALLNRDDNGKPVTMTGVCLDITEMKKGAEQTLFKLNEELLRSNKELEQFAYVASHDLQEPLRMVSSFTQLLAQRYENKLDNDAKEFIQYAVDGAKRMQILINDLLAYSRINKYGKEFTKVNMNIVMQQVIKNYSMGIMEKNAMITYDNLPDIHADESQMVQLLQNLVGNAIKFCRKTPRIQISCKEENKMYTFAVKDNGIGIEPEYFDKIFQIFQRLQSKEEYPGTGIGLAICRRIVERHGGKIWLDSQIDIGSTFYFTLLKV